MQQESKLLLFFILGGLGYVVIIFFYKMRIYTLVQDSSPDDDTAYLREMLEKVQKLSEGKENERIHRLPDVILVGVQKCGTGGLSNFLSFHPSMRVLKGEGKYFGKKEETKTLQEYIDMLPPALDHELIMEKTPNYFENVAPRYLHKLMPNLKIMVILCEPVRRALSSFAMQQELFGMKPETFDNFVQRTVVRSRKVATPIVTRGVYHTHVKKWMNEFGDDFKFLDGEKFIKNPGAVMREVQAFLGIPVLLREEDFVLDETKGMFCMSPWWEKSQNEQQEALHCLSKRKGRTRSKLANRAMSDKTRKILERYFEPRNKKLFKLIKKEFNW